MRVNMYTYVKRNQQWYSGSFLLYLPDKLRKNIYIELFESYIAYDARARGEKETHE